MVMTETNKWYRVFNSLKALKPRENTVLRIMYGWYNSHKQKPTDDIITVNNVGLRNLCPELKSESNVRDILIKLCAKGVITKVQNGVKGKSSPKYRINFDIISAMELGGSEIEDEVITVDKNVSFADLYRQNLEMINEIKELRKGFQILVNTLSNKMIQI